MRPQIQSRTGPDGRCFEACLASILEIAENAVPYFSAKSEVQFLREVNHFLDRWELQYQQVPVGSVPTPVGWHLVEGISPRGRMHAVVANRGNMAFDPHPQDGTGRFLVKPIAWGLLLPRNPPRGY